MWHRLVVGFLLAILAFFIVRYFSTDSFTNWDSIVETPATGPIAREPPPRGDMSISPGGPNTPNQAAPRNMPTVRAPPTEASDPYSETAEDANAPERITHPERSFSPGIVPEQTAINQEAGLAGETANSPQALQQFSPEFVQNGGSFFGAVSAMEDESPNYSAF